MNGYDNDNLLLVMLDDDLFPIEREVDWGCGENTTQTQQAEKPEIV